MTTDLLSVPDFGLLQNSVAAANALTVRSRSGYNADMLENIWAKQHFTLATPHNLSTTPYNDELQYEYRFTDRR